MPHAIAALALLCGCAFVPDRHRLVDLGESPSDSLPARLSEGYFYQEAPRPDGDSCFTLAVILLLKNGYFHHLPGLTGGRECKSTYKRFDTPEKGHAMVQAILDGDSLHYFTIDSWGRYAITGNAITVGIFRPGDMFSKEYIEERGYLSGDTLTLSYENWFDGREVKNTYHFRAHPLHVDHGKIPLNKGRFKSRSLPPVWFWWGG